MVLSDTKRRQLASNAYRLMSEEEIVWTTGAWFKDPDAPDDTFGSSEPMGAIRQWLRNRGFMGPRNKRRKCNVCAEGALLMALAYDETIPDDAVGSRLLDEFDAKAERVLSDGGWFDDTDDEGVPLRFESIPDWNDSNAHSQTDVLRFLEELSQ